ncbi:hypothetical protein RXV86_16435 [Alisedimentitalea sp. MJ-SS2]|uniref:hypothetical protein n=1 Tax=Aliisedimentitalea sp. MJ-SS2 TaxID=3049795 RepID=UPI0029090AC1|nr:hypothetical protein [Alisedimentitalea sp. MJ-SS2]MDU8928983.1 hypothetical protein [Alisedimentitalea sp. MJ-SS2]
MKSTTIIAALTAATITGAANADSRIERFCGAGHENEITSLWDVKPNPDGYYVASLNSQISEGDPRIVLTNDPGFHLCTTGVALPGMPENEIYRLKGKRKVKFLFVPISDWSVRPSS